LHSQNRPVSHSFVGVFEYKNQLQSFIMDNWFKNIKYYILSIREKHLLNSLKNTTRKSFSNKTTKNVLGHGADLTLNSETLKIIEQVKINVNEIVKSTDANPETLLNYVKAAKTPVYRLKYADKFLNLIMEEEGLIYEKKGFVALYLSIITEGKFKFQTPPMFILRKDTIDKNLMLHNFYRWYSLKSNLPGFEYEVQRKFRESLFDKTGRSIKKFSLEDIIAIKEAVARDQEATDYVLEYMKLTEGSKNVVSKLKSDGKADV